MGQYRKFLVALLTAVVEGGALWADASPWVVSASGLAGAVLVYLVPNARPLPDAVRSVRSGRSGM